MKTKQASLKLNNQENCLRVLGAFNEMQPEQEPFTFLFFQEESLYDPL